ncbi:hypothetical protein SISNIDRAFT_416741 [Sistotremastrum niveocremeum HHB9708]|uniref:Fungal-type protein kinase domain-containing protein n=1 Tax=Sistotremastrum niveocremeum HHB9708 TaxID=1314777 RepID=A0A164QIW6_9AGAM|nr:hypothetical protein SISNIDRAFT_416741 [Sistotremastrum niveocremeum HHB9708]
MVWFSMLAPILSRDRFDKMEYYEHLCLLVALINGTISFKLSRENIDELEKGWLSW